MGDGPSGQRLLCCQRRRSSTADGDGRGTKGADDNLSQRRAARPGEEENPKDTSKLRAATGEDPLTSKPITTTATLRFAMLLTLSAALLFLLARPPPAKAICSVFHVTETFFSAESLGRLVRPFSLSSILIFRIPLLLCTLIFLSVISAVAVANYIPSTGTRGGRGTGLGSWLGGEMGGWLSGAAPTLLAAVPGVLCADLGSRAKGADGRLQGNACFPLAAAWAVMAAALRAATWPPGAVLALCFVWLRLLVALARGRRCGLRAGFELGPALHRLASSLSVRFVVGTVEADGSARLAACFGPRDGPLAAVLIAAGHAWVVVEGAERVAALPRDDGVPVTAGSNPRADVPDLDPALPASSADPSVRFEDCPICFSACAESETFTWTCPPTRVGVSRTRHTACLECTVNAVFRLGRCPWCSTEVPADVLASLRSRAAERDLEIPSLARVGYLDAADPEAAPGYPRCPDGVRAVCCTDPDADPRFARDRRFLTWGPLAVEQAPLDTPGIGDAVSGWIPGWHCVPGLLDGRHVGCGEFLHFSEELRAATAARRCACPALVVRTVAAPSGTRDPPVAVVRCSRPATCSLATRIASQRSLGRSVFGPSSPSGLREPALEAPPRPVPAPPAWVRLWASGCTRCACCAPPLADPRAVWFQPLLTVRPGTTVSYLFALAAAFLLHGAGPEEFDYDFAAWGVQGAFGRLVDLVAGYLAEVDGVIPFDRPGHPCTAWQNRVQDRGGVPVVLVTSIEELHNATVAAATRALRNATVATVAAATVALPEAREDPVRPACFGTAPTASGSGAPLPSPAASRSPSPAGSAAPSAASSLPWECDVCGGVWCACLSGAPAVAAADPGPGPAAVPPPAPRPARRWSRASAPGERSPPPGAREAPAAVAVSREASPVAPAGAGVAAASRSANRGDPAGVACPALGLAGTAGGPGTTPVSASAAPSRRRRRDDAEADAEASAEPRRRLGDAPAGSLGWVPPPSGPSRRRRAEDAEAPAVPRRRVGGPPGPPPLGCPPPPPPRVRSRLRLVPCPPGVEPLVCASSPAHGPTELRVGTQSGVPAVLWVCSARGCAFRRRPAGPVRRLIPFADGGNADGAVHAPGLAAPAGDPAAPAADAPAGLLDPPLSAPAGPADSGPRVLGSPRRACSEPRSAARGRSPVGGAPRSRSCGAGAGAGPEGVAPVPEAPRAAAPPAAPHAPLGSLGVARAPAFPPPVVRPPRRGRGRGGRGGGGLSGRSGGPPPGDPPGGSGGPGLPPGVSDSPAGDASAQSPAPLSGAAVAARAADGARVLPWHLLDAGAAPALRARVRTVQDVPIFARAAYVGAADWAYGELVDAYGRWDRAGAQGDAELLARAELGVERCWALVLLLERLLLRTTATRGRAGEREFEERFRKFWSGEWDALLAEIAPRAPPRPRAPSTPTLDERGEAARHHCHLGEVSRARSRLDGAAIAPGDETTLALLRERPSQPGPLGVPPPPPPRAPGEQAAPVVLDRAKFLGNVRSAPRGGAPGCSGTRFEHHKLLLTSEPASENLFLVAQRLARGQLPPRARAACALGRLTALLKDTPPNAPRKVRGIVSGHSLRRLVARTLNQQFICQFDAACAPYQFALGSRAGTDAAALLVKFCCEEGRVVVQTDARGAFDHVSRKVMLEELSDVAPELVPFVSLFYSEQSTYLWQDDSGAVFDIPQAEGGEQGDPLMPALFSLGIRRALAAVGERLDPGDLLVAFLDDVFVLTSEERARRSFDVVEHELRTRAGIDLERTKTRAFAFQPAPAPPGIAELGRPDEPIWRADPGLPADQRGLRVLGMPMGDPAFVEGFLVSRMRDEQRLLARLPYVRDPQCEWLLLSLCAEPRANHVLRTAAGPPVADYATAHDDALGSAFAAVARFPAERVPTAAKALLNLPRRYGGLGVRSAARSAPAAHFAGWAAALPLWQTRYPAECQRALAALGLARGALPSIRFAQEAAASLAAEGWDVPAWDELAQGADPTSRGVGLAFAGSGDVPDPVVPEPGEWRHGWQFYAADHLERCEANRLFVDLNPTGRAMLLNQCGPHAGDGLAAIPTGPETRPRPGRFVTTLRRRAWLPLGLGDANCPGCGAQLDPLGFHLTSCMASGRVQSRAAPLERAFMGVCAEARGRCRWKPLVRTLNFGPPGAQVVATDQRQLDFVSFGLQAFGGLPLAVDATLVSPISAEGVPHPGCSSAADAVFARAEAQIAVDYDDVARGGRATLLCLASSTGGRWNRSALTLVRELVFYHAQSQPAVLRRSVALALSRRWWAVLATARDEAIAASLDPTDYVDERALVPIDPVDVWLRDPPGPSVLGAR